MARLSLRCLALDDRNAREFTIENPIKPTIADRLGISKRTAELGRALRPTAIDDARRLVGLLFALMRGKWLDAPCERFSVEDWAALESFPQAAIGAVCLKLAIARDELPPSAAELLERVRQEAEAAHRELATLESQWSAAVLREPAEEAA